MDQQEVFSISGSEKSADSQSEKFSEKNASTVRRRRGKYQLYAGGDVEEAVSRVKAGELTQREACKRFGVPQATLSRKVNGKNSKQYGGQTVFTSQEEGEIVRFLDEVASWGYPIGYEDLRILIKSHLDKCGKVEQRFVNNTPGNEFIRSFMRRNNLTLLKASNIRVARSAVTGDELRKYFNNIQNALSEVQPNAIFNYDETCFKDDPGEKSVIVSMGTRRVERVREETKCTFSVMCCGSAAGEFLPPMVVYKSRNVYEAWTKGGPDGSVYDCSDSGWFDGRTFAIWYFSVFVPFAANIAGKKVLVGDNLASHFSPEVRFYFA